ncbi:MAG: hypothetical protein HC855_07655 [Rhizobiales bacterium]|nr:hypothetical protein [Hyphomicrobiales bacterium]
MLCSSVIAVASENRRLGRACLGARDEPLRLLAGEQFLKRLAHERIVVRAIEEGAVDFLRVLRPAAPLQEIAVSLHNAERGSRLFVGLFVKHLGPNRHAHQVRDQSGVEILEIRERLVGVQLVERLERPVEGAIPGIGPC